MDWATGHRCPSGLGTLPGVQGGRGSGRPLHPRASCYLEIAAMLSLWETHLDLGAVGSSLAVPSSSRLHSRDTISGGSGESAGERRLGTDLSENLKRGPGPPGLCAEGS